MDWIVSPSLPPKLHVGVLTPRMTVFGDGAFKEVIKVKWGHKGWALIQQCCVMRKRPEVFFPHQHRQRKDQVKTVVTSQKEISHQKPNCPAPWCGTCSFQDCENINFCYVSHPIYDILLWQPRYTNTLGWIPIFLISDSCTPPTKFSPSIITQPHLQLLAT